MFLNFGSIFKFLLFSFLFFLPSQAAFNAHAADLFKPAPKIQIYDAQKKQFYFRDRVRKTDAQWRQELSLHAYVITRNKGTETAFTGAYWNNHQGGMYRCLCCGIDLFSSEDKFDSGSGLPSFDRPVMDTNILIKEDRSLPEVRLEVLCARCEAHLGYLYDDESTQTHKKYLINSAALSFQRSSE